MAVERSGIGEENAARAGIAQAAAALSGRRPDIPATFIEQLYGRAVPEDLARYAPDDLAVLAARAYDFIADRSPGTPKIRCETIQLTASGDHNRVTVSSRSSTTTCRFFSIRSWAKSRSASLGMRLVAHPMFWHAPRGQQAEGARLAGHLPDTRESFIHIHLAPFADDAGCAELVHALQHSARRSAAGGAGLAPDARAA